MTPDSSEFAELFRFRAISASGDCYFYAAHHSMLPWHVEKRRGAKVSRNRHDWYVLKEKKLQSKYETDSSEDMAKQKYTFKHEGGRGSKRLWEGGKDSEREQKKGLLLKLVGTCKLSVNAPVSATVQLFLQWNATIGALYESIYCVWISPKNNFFYAIEMT